jgi:N-acetylmuramic acid 6-phosphate (MurNAc-6-P) etherase
MLEDERRNNFALRLSIDNLKNIIEILEDDKKPTKEQITYAKEDINNMVDAITNYHARFIELLETVNNIKELEKRLNL